MHKSMKSKKGFTLVELMVVVAIIAILAAVAVPSYLSYKRDAKIEVAKSSFAAVIDSINGSNLLMNKLVGIDESGNVSGTIRDAIVALDDAVVVDSIKLDAPLSVYCVYNNDTDFFMVNKDADADDWLALYDDGLAYTVS